MAGRSARKRDRFRVLFGQGGKAASSYAKISEHSSLSPSLSLSTSPARHRFSEDTLRTLTLDEQALVRRVLAENAGDINEAVQRAFDAAGHQKQACEDKRWRLNFRGREITLRDEADKVVRWIDRFKSAGDVLANSDPIHVGLPWAGIRMMLEVSVAESRQMVAVLNGLNMAMYAAHRLRAYWTYFTRLPSTPTTATFERAMIKMFAMLLQFFNDAVATCSRDLMSRTWQAFWNGSNLDDFESKCKYWMAHVEIDASNCDRDLAQQDRDSVDEWKKSLEQTLQKLEEIKFIESSLAMLHNKVDLAKLATANGATYNSYEEEGLARCLEGTRTQLLEQIHSWVESGKFIFWLCGKAGTGKSTISRTVAYALDHQQRLGASFFFKRGEADRGTSRQFFPTIARQLADKIPGLGRPIADALEQDSLLCGRGLQEQFEKLILLPLLGLGQSQVPLPVICIIIDALDECERNDDIRMILTLLAKIGTTTSIHLRLFVTSRPELPVKLGFNSMSVNLHQDVVLEEVQAPSIEHDIRLYFKHRFTEMKAEAKLGNTYVTLSEDWPGNADIEALVGLAVPLFVSAFTICRYVAECEHVDRLAAILQRQQHVATTSLENTYLPILDRLINGKDAREQERIIAAFKTLIGSIVVLADPLSPQSLSRLLNLSLSSIDRCLRNLHAILSLPSDLNGPIRLFHLSFREFITDPETATRTRFWIDEAVMHGNVAMHCLHLLCAQGVLRKDICQVTAPGFRRVRLKKSRILECISAEVAYACSYWVFHAVKCGERIRDGGPAHSFLQEHFLHWLEVLSWLGRLPIAIAQLNDLKSLVEIENGTQLSSFLHDAHRFILPNRHVVNLAPLQLYYSSLVFAPDRSLVKQTYAPSHHVPWLCLLPQVASAWTAEVLMLEGHLRSVTAVAFSPDGRTLASGSDDNTVRVWSASTGEEILKLEGHRYSVFYVSFSLDGSVLISASYDGVIRIWNAITGEEVHHLNEHDTHVYAIAASPDGRTIAAGFADSTIRTWDMKTGQMMLSFQGHESAVTTVAYSPDGKMLVSASFDQTIRMWSPTTGREIRMLNRDYVDHYIAFSPGGQMVVVAPFGLAVQALDTTTGKEIWRLGNHSDAITAINFSPDGQILASASCDNIIRLHSVTTGNELCHLEEHEDSVTDLAYSPDGLTLVSASDDTTIRMWSLVDILTQNIRDREVQVSKSHRQQVIYITFSPDGSLVASASHDFTVRVWSSRGEELLTLEHEASVYDIVLSSDGRRLASVSHNGTMRMWSISTGEEMWKVECRYVVARLAFTLDRQKIALASADGAIRVLDSASGMEIWEQSCDTLIHAIAFSPDGRTLASASLDDTIQIWSAVTGKEMHRFQCDTDDMQLSFTNDSRFLKAWKTVFDLQLYASRARSTEPNRTDAIRVGGAWIQRDGQDLLWLPHGYRGSCSAVHGNTLVVGQNSGAVSFFGFTDL